jgi:hypothetical protein
MQHPVDVTSSTREMTAMRADSIYLLGLIGMGSGASATVLARRIFPLWFLEAGQEHGRYARLGRSIRPSRSGGQGGIKNSVKALPDVPAAHLIVA